MKNFMRKRISLMIPTLLIVTGLSMLIYVAASGYAITVNARQTIGIYQAGIDQLDDETCERLLADAMAYNEGLAAMGPHLRDPKEEEMEEYFSLMNPLDTGIIGYVEIEKIDISLPIYHSASDEVLKTGVGHLPGSSLPVGGESAHCIISAHREFGLFKDLDRLEEGDAFSLHILHETLTYEVDQISTILPIESYKLRIETGQDYCTLMTCTPYGSTSHRLLVRGHRIIS